MKVAVCRKFKNKVRNQKDFSVLTRSFTNEEITPNQLADEINKGFTFCTQHKNGSRKSSNFICSDFLAVDIDKGLRIEEALSEEFVKSYCTIFYTTASHSDEEHKFRLIFQLEREITTQQEMKLAYKGIIKKFGGDPSCKDACRMFFGSKGSNPKVYDNTMPNKILDEIIESGKESLTQHSSKKNDRKGTDERSTVRSRKAIDEYTSIKIDTGDEYLLGDLTPGTQIHCPVHVDNNPSAFVLKSKTGILGVHCMTCATTFFVSNEPPSYDFNYNLSNLDSMCNDGDIVHQNEFGATITESSIERINERYLPKKLVYGDINFIKSPKGTGKTQWLKSLVNECKREDKEEEKQRKNERHLKVRNQQIADRKEKPYHSILLIGHRRSLIKSVSKRLGLVSYIDTFYLSEDGSSADYKNTPKPYYAICADSLSTTLNPEKDKYEIIIIDEVEQVISHLTSSTLKERRNDTFEYFKHYIDTAKKVYALDADLNRLTVISIHDLLTDPNKGTRIILNDWKEEEREIQLFSDKNHLKQDFYEALDRNERCFVCTNSKEEVNKISLLLKDRYKDKKRILSISSDNSTTQEAQDFINNIQKEVLKYDAVIVSPSLGTGVDITFDKGGCFIENTYGIFESRVNTHFDIDQQISRVRNPGKVKVWISPQKFQFETIGSVIKNEIGGVVKKSRILLGINSNGAMNYHSNDAYLNLYTEVTSLQRGSKNNLKDNLIQLKKHNGWKVVEVDKNQVLSKKGREATKYSEELRQQQKNEDILNAKLITRKEYSDLKRISRKKNLNSDELHAMRRYEIESFYCEDATDELLNLDNNGVFRKAIKNYIRYITDDSDLKRLDEMESGVIATPDNLLRKYNIEHLLPTIDTYKNQEHGKTTHFIDRTQNLLWKKTLKRLLNAAGLSDAHQSIITRTTIDSNSLSKFSILWSSLKGDVKILFDLDVRSDYSKKPVQELNKLLNILGLKLEKTRTKKEKGVKVYYYQISRSKYQVVNKYITIKTNPSNQENWFKKRDKMKTNRLFTEENKLLDPMQGIYVDSDSIAHRSMTLNKTEPQDQNT